MTAQASRKPHQRFTVGRWGAGQPVPRWAILHQKPPTDLGDGRLSISVRIPILFASPELDGQEAILNRIATLLNTHWEQGQ